MNIERTERGFECIEFSDQCNNPCSLQASSAIGDYADSFAKPGSSYVWLGQGVHRMHLDREMVMELIVHLQAWLYAGSFEQAAKAAGKEKR